MEEDNKKKDIKNIYRWDEDGTVEEKPEEILKTSKKVRKREEREKEKQRMQAIIKERQKSRITKKGRIWIIAGSAVVILALVAGLLFGYLGLGVDLTKKLAKFDNMKVTQKDLGIYIDFLKNQNPDSIPPEDDPQYTVLQQNIMDSIIVLKLLQKYGKENGYAIDNTEVDAELAKIVANYPSQADFEKDLKDKKISQSFLRDQITDQLLRDKIFANVTEDITVIEEELQAFYDENKDIQFTVPEQKKVSHILVAFNVPEGQELNDTIRNEAKAKIDDIEKKLKDGSDFAELAKQYSDDTVSAENGGDIGFISKGQTVPEFEEAAFALDVGQTSPIVETYYGFHIIKVTEMQDSYIKSFIEVKESIQSYLLNNKQMEAWQDFVYSLVEKSGVVYTTALKGQLTEVPGTIESTDTSESPVSETS